MVIRAAESTGSDSFFSLAQAITDKCLNILAGGPNGHGQKTLSEFFSEYIAGFDKIDGSFDRHGGQVFGHMGGRSQDILEVERIKLRYHNGINAALFSPKAVGQLVGGNAVAR